MIKLTSILNEPINEESPCWKGYRQIGMKTKNGKQVPNCVPINDSVNEYIMPRDVDSKMKELGISKIPISSKGERILKGMVKEKFLDKVTNADRLIYFYQSLGDARFGYGIKGKPLSPLVDRFSNDLMSDSIFFDGKMIAYQVAMIIKDMKANGEEIDSPYDMVKEYFKNFGMNYSRNRVFDSAIHNLEEWMKRNKIQESVFKRLKGMVKNESINESLDVKKIHNDILKFLKTKKGVEIQDYSDFPNKYGANVSTYYVKYDIEDKFNYSNQEIKIEYSTSRVFIPGKGYFPFKTVNDIKNIINKKTTLNESVNEVNAVSGGKVHKFITGKNLTYKGKKYSDIEFELLGIDNNDKLIKLKIIAPKNLFGQEIKVPFKTIRRGPFIKTNTSKINETSIYRGLDYED